MGSKAKAPVVGRMLEGEMGTKLQKMLMQRALVVLAEKGA